VKGSAWKSGRMGRARSSGNRSRSVGTLEPEAASGRPTRSSSPTFTGSRRACGRRPEELCDGRKRPSSCTTEGSRRAAGVGSAQTSSSRKCESELVESASGRRVAPSGASLPSLDFTRLPTILDRMPRASTGAHRQGANLFLEQSYALFEVRIGPALGVRHLADKPAL